MNTYPVKRTPETRQFIEFLEKKIFYHPIDDIRKFARGAASYNFLVTVNKQKVLVKLTRPHGAKGIKRLARVCQAISENKQLAVARLIKVNQSLYFKYEKKYGLVMEYCDGESLPSYKMKTVHFEQILLAYKLFQQTKWPNKSDLLPIYSMEEHYQRHVMFLENALKNLNDLPQPKRFIFAWLCKKHLAFLMQLGTTKIDWSVDELEIIHGDFHNNNLLFKNGKLLTFLDFEEVKDGHPTEDLVRFIICLVQRLPFFINPYRYINKWLKLCNQQFHYTTEQWIGGLNSYYLQRADKAFSVKNKFASKRQIKIMFKLWLFFNRYNAILKCIHRLKNQ